MTRESRHLKITGYPDNCSEETLLEHFNSYGRVQRIEFLKDDSSSSVAPTATAAPASGGNAGSNGNGQPVTTTTTSSANENAAVVSFMDMRTAAKAFNAEHSIRGHPIKVTYYEPTGGASIGGSVVTHEAASGEVMTSSQSNRRNGGPASSLSHGYQRNSSRSHGWNSSGQQQQSSSAEQQQRPSTAGGGDDQSGSSSHVPPQTSGGGGSRRSISGRRRSSSATKRRPSSRLSPGRRTRRKSSSSSSDEASCSRSRSRSSRSHSRSRASRSPSLTASSRTGCGSGGYSVDSRGRPTTDGGGERAAGVTSASDRRSSMKDSSDTGGGGGFLHKNNAILVRNLPLRSTDSSLKDGLFFTYKKHGKVVSVKVVGEGGDRYAVVTFRRSTDTQKAVDSTNNVMFFGSKISVESAPANLNVDDNERKPLEKDIDQYHPKSSRTLYVGNLENRATPEQLRHFFERFGDVVDVDIKNRETPAPFAFVQFTEILSVVKAIHAMEQDGYIGGNRVKVGFGKPLPSQMVWIAELPELVSREYLSRKMNFYGNITDILIDKVLHQALVTYDCIEVAQGACQDMKGRTICNRKVQVDFCSRELHDLFVDRMFRTNQLRSRDAVYLGEPGVLPPPTGGGGVGGEQRLVGQNRGDDFYPNENYYPSGSSKNYSQQRSSIDSNKRSSHDINFDERHSYNYAVPSSYNDDYESRDRDFQRSQVQQNQREFYKGRSLTPPPSSRHSSSRHNNRRKTDAPVSDWSSSFNQRSAAAGGGADPRSSNNRRDRSSPSFQQQQRGRGGPRRRSLSADRFRGSDRQASSSSSMADRPSRLVAVLPTDSVGNGPIRNDPASSADAKQHGASSTAATFSQVTKRPRTPPSPRKSSRSGVGGGSSRMRGRPVSSAAARRRRHQHHQHRRRRRSSTSADGSSSGGSSNGDDKTNSSTSSSTSNQNTDEESEAESVGSRNKEPKRILRPPEPAAIVEKQQQPVSIEQKPVLILPDLVQSGSATTKLPAFIPPHESALKLVQSAAANINNNLLAPPTAAAVANLCQQAQPGKDPSPDMHKLQKERAQLLQMLETLDGEEHHGVGGGQKLAGGSTTTAVLSAAIAAAGVAVSVSNTATIVGIKTEKKSACNTGLANLNEIFDISWMEKLAEAQKRKKAAAASCGAESNKNTASITCSRKSSSNEDNFGKNAIKREPSCDSTSSHKFAGKKHANDDSGPPSYHYTSLGGAGGSNSKNSAVSGCGSAAASSSTAAAAACKGKRIPLEPVVDHSADLGGVLCDPRFNPPQISLVTDFPLPYFASKKHFGSSTNLNSRTADHSPLKSTNRLDFKSEFFQSPSTQGQSFTQANTSAAQQHQQPHSLLQTRLSSGSDMSPLHNLACGNGSADSDALMSPPPSGGCGGPMGGGANSSWATHSTDIFGESLSPVTPVCSDTRASFEERIKALDDKFVELDRMIKVTKDRPVHRSTANIDYSKYKVVKKPITATSNLPPTPTQVTTANSNNLCGAGSNNNERYSASTPNKANASSTSTSAERRKLSLPTSTVSSSKSSVFDQDAERLSSIEQKYTPKTYNAESSAKSSSKTNEGKTPLTINISTNQQSTASILPTPPSADHSSSTNPVTPTISPQSQNPIQGILKNKPKSANIPSLLSATIGGGPPTAPPTAFPLPPPLDGAHAGNKTSTPVHQDPRSMARRESLKSPAGAPNSMTSTNVPGGNLLHSAGLKPAPLIDSRYSRPPFGGGSVIPAGAPQHPPHPHGLSRHASFSGSTMSVDHQQQKQTGGGGTGPSQHRVPQTPTVLSGYNLDPRLQHSGGTTLTGSSQRHEKTFGLRHDRPTTSSSGTDSSAKTQDSASATTYGKTVPPAGYNRRPPFSTPSGGGGGGGGSSAATTAAGKPLPPDNQPSKELRNKDLDALFKSKQQNSGHNVSNSRLSSTSLDSSDRSEFYNKDSPKTSATATSASKLPKIMKKPATTSAFAATADKSASDNKTGIGKDEVGIFEKFTPKSMSSSTNVSPDKKSSPKDSQGSSKEKDKDKHHHQKKTLLSEKELEEKRKRHEERKKTKAAQKKANKSLDKEKSSSGKHDSSKSHKNRSGNSDQAKKKSSSSSGKSQKKKVSSDDDSDESEQSDEEEAGHRRTAQRSDSDSSLSEAEAERRVAKNLEKEWRKTMQEFAEPVGLSMYDRVKRRSSATTNTKTVGGTSANAEGSSGVTSGSATAATNKSDKFNRLREKRNEKNNQRAKHRRIQCSDSSTESGDENENDQSDTEAATAGAESSEKSIRTAVASSSTNKDHVTSSSANKNRDESSSVTKKDAPAAVDSQSKSEPGQKQANKKKSTATDEKEPKKKPVNKKSSHPTTSSATTSTDTTTLKKVKSDSKLSVQDVYSSDKTSDSENDSDKGQRSDDNDNDCMDEERKEESKKSKQQKSIKKDKTKTGGEKTVTSSKDKPIGQKVSNKPSAAADRSSKKDTAADQSTDSSEQDESDDHDDVIDKEVTGKKSRDRPTTPQQQATGNKKSSLQKDAAEKLRKMKELKKKQKKMALRQQKEREKAEKSAKSIKKSAIAAEKSSTAERKNRKRSAEDDDDLSENDEKESDVAKKLMKKPTEKDKETSAALKKRKKVDSSSSSISATNINQKTNDQSDSAKHDKQHKKMATGSAEKQQHKEHKKRKKGDSSSSSVLSGGAGGGGGGGDHVTHRGESTPPQSPQAKKIKQEVTSPCLNANLPSSSMTSSSTTVSTAHIVTKAAKKQIDDSSSSLSTTTVAPSSGAAGMTSPSASAIGQSGVVAAAAPVLSAVLVTKAAKKAIDFTVKEEILSEEKSRQEEIQKSIADSEKDEANAAVATIQSLDNAEISADIVAALKRSIGETDVDDDDDLPDRSEPPVEVSVQEIVVAEVCSEAVVVDETDQSGSAPPTNEEEEENNNNKTDDESSRPSSTTAVPVATVKSEDDEQQDQQQPLVDEPPAESRDQADQQQKQQPISDDERNNDEDSSTNVVDKEKESGTGTSTTTKVFEALTIKVDNIDDNPLHPDLIGQKSDGSSHVDEVIDDVVHGYVEIEPEELKQMSAANNINSRMPSPPASSAAPPTSQPIGFQLQLHQQQQQHHVSSDHVTRHESASSASSSANRILDNNISHVTMQSMSSSIGYVPKQSEYPFATTKQQPQLSMSNQDATLAAVNSITQHQQPIGRDQQQQNLLMQQQQMQHRSLQQQQQSYHAVQQHAGGTMPPQAADFMRSSVPSFTTGGGVNVMNQSVKTPPTSSMSQLANFSSQQAAILHHYQQQQQQQQANASLGMTSSTGASSSAYAAMVGSKVTQVGVAAPTSLANVPTNQYEAAALYSMQLQQQQQQQQQQKQQAAWAAGKMMGTGGGVSSASSVGIHRFLPTSTAASSTVSYLEHQQQQQEMHMREQKQLQQQQQIQQQQQQQQIQQQQQHERFLAEQQRQQTEKAAAQAKHQQQQQQQQLQQSQQQQQRAAMENAANKNAATSMQQHQNDAMMSHRWLLERYPVIWQGYLALKNDNALVQMHLVLGNPQLLPRSLPTANEMSPIPVLRIMQRMRLEEQQLEGVSRRMQLQEEHCVLVVLPCGQDRNHILQQSTILNDAFITYLQQKQAAGIVHVVPQGATQPAYVVHVFPPCKFAEQSLYNSAREFFHSIIERQTSFLFVVITTAQGGT